MCVERNNLICRTRFGAAVSLVLALTAPLLIAGESAEHVTGKKKPTKSKVGRRLIRQIAEGSDEDVMATVMRLMKDSGRRLDLDFDPGAETQAVQQDIVDRLDEAILAAAKQRRRSRQRSRPSGDRRTRMTKRQDAAKDNPHSGDRQPPGAASERDGQPGSESRVDAARGDLRETRRGWGHLPPRERDEVIQGSDEASLERYREWVERYYRALQETDE